MSVFMRTQLEALRPHPLTNVVFYNENLQKKNVE